MRLLLLMSLIALALGEEVADHSKLTDINDVPEVTTIGLQPFSSAEESSEEKKLDKRSYVSWGYSSLPYPLLYSQSYGLPWYGYGGINYRVAPAVYPSVKVAPVYSRVITLPAISAIGYGGWKW